MSFLLNFVMKVGLEFRNMPNHVLNLCIEKASAMISSRLFLQILPKAATEARKHDQIVGVRGQSHNKVNEPSQDATSSLLRCIGGVRTRIYKEHGEFDKFYHSLRVHTRTHINLPIGWYIIICNGLV